MGRKREVISERQVKRLGFRVISVIDVIRISTVIIIKEVPLRTLGLLGLFGLLK